MIAVRVQRTGSRYYVFLMWNLFLAIVPLVASTLLRLANHLERSSAIQIILFFIWLLFLPNAPYVLTDLLHLRIQSQVPAWFDLALLLSCAGTGMLFGYLSLIDVQGIVSNRFTRAIGWIVAVSSLLLSGFAIYLGRFLRWNSWDVLTRPSIVFAIVDGFLNPTAHIKTLAVTTIFGMILVLGYISVRALLAQPLTIQRVRETNRES